MRIVLISAWLLLSTFMITHGQTKCDDVSSLISNGQYELALIELDKLEHEASQDTSPIDIKDIYYQKACVNDLIEDCETSYKYFQMYCTIAEETKSFAVEYVDAILYIMRHHYKHQNYEEAILLGRKVVELPEDVISACKNSPYIFSTMISALSYLRRYSEIDKLYKRGIYYRNMSVKFSDEAYYELPLTSIVAYIMMGEIATAQSVFDEAMNTYKCSGISSNDIDKSFTYLGEILTAEKLEDKFSKLETRRKTIETISDRLLLVDPSSDDGSNFVKDYFKIIRETLGYFNFNMTDPKDEEYWNWFLSRMHVYFYIMCDSLPNREAILYDNIILKKNFIDYHSEKLYKKPYAWNEIAEMLDEDEAAIEINQLPDEILILRRQINSPISIKIDSLLFDELEKVDIHNPGQVRDLYSRNSPLSQLWATIEPHLKGVSRIYLSTSNIFNRFNFSTIQIENGIVSDKYELRMLLSTSDIEHLKEKSKSRTADYSNAVLYGGIHYDVDEKFMQSESNKYSVNVNRQEWSMTRGLEGIRGEFGYLEGTLTEVSAINTLLNKANVETTLLSGVKANEESFKHLSGKNVDILHVATHGFLLSPIFNSDNSHQFKEMLGSRYQTILSQSGLLFAGANIVWEGKILTTSVEDGILTSKEISELDLSKIKLAVLSACDTGLGDDSNLTGVSYGVLHAFKHAGVDTILACLWKVDDYVTNEFMQIFYKQLVKYDCDTALKKAQIELCNMGYDNPYYWAGYVIIH